MAPTIKSVSLNFRAFFTVILILPTNLDLEADCFNKIIPYGCK